MASHWGYHRSSIFGVCRPGELIFARRSQLLLPEDMLSSAPLAYVVHPLPKTRRRGARVQHSSIHDAFTIELLRSTFGHEPADTPLISGSAAQFRRRFSWLLRSLGLPPCAYTPGGLRGGGACHAFSLERDVSLLC